MKEVRAPAASAVMLLVHVLMGTAIGGLVWCTRHSLCTTPTFEFVTMDVQARAGVSVVVLPVWLQNQCEAAVPLELCRMSALECGLLSLLWSHALMIACPCCWQDAVTSHDALELFQGECCCLQ